MVAWLGVGHVLCSGVWVTLSVRDRLATVVKITRVARGNIGKEKGRTVGVAYDYNPLVYCN